MLTAPARAPVTDFESRAPASPGTGGPPQSCWAFLGNLDHDPQATWGLLAVVASSSTGALVIPAVKLTQTPHRQGRRTDPGQPPPPGRSPRSGTRSRASAAIGHQLCCRIHGGDFVHDLIPMAGALLQSQGAHADARKRQFPVRMVAEATAAVPADSDSALLLGGEVEGDHLLHPLLGAAIERQERSEERANDRNGYRPDRNAYRPRSLATRAGHIDLLIPRPAGLPPSGTCGPGASCPRASATPPPGGRGPLRRGDGGQRAGATRGMPWWPPWACRAASPTCATSQTFFMDTDATTSRMGVWPPGAGLQGQAPNHPMLLRLRVVVVSDGEKAARSRQVSDGKMSKSESPLTQPLRGSPGYEKSSRSCQNGCR